MCIRDRVKTKRRKNVSISNVAGARTYSIETEQDIDKFLSEMKQKLKMCIRDSTNLLTNAACALNAPYIVLIL